MAERLPERLRDDPVAVQQSYRLMLAATARLAIDAIVGDRAHPVFVPEINLAMNIFQPNADSVYRSAMIDAKGTYCLRGKRRSEEHTSELQSLMRISYAVFCLKKKTNTKQQ